jgi:hypothetical protein
MPRSVPGDRSAGDCGTVARGLVSALSGPAVGTLLACTLLWGAATRGDNGARAPGTSVNAPSPVSWVAERVRDEYVARGAVVGLARGYLGIGNEPVPSSVECVRISDREAPRNLGVTDRPAWLVRFDGVTYRTKSQPERAYGPITLVVAVDVRTGGFLEAFTDPKPASEWPPQVLTPGHEYSMDVQGYRYDVPANAPGCALLEALSSMPVDPKSVGQVVVRYALFTAMNRGVTVRRADGERLVPSIVRRPMWVASFLGLRLPTAGGADAGEQYYYWELNFLVDADDCVEKGGFANR